MAAGCIAGANASTSFRGAAGGNIGMSIAQPEKDKATEFSLPAGFFGAGQVNFGDTAVLRAELGVKTKDSTDGNILRGMDGEIKLRELSLVFNRRTVFATHYFSFFLGEFDPVGSDSFLSRVFGIENISSVLTENYNTLRWSPVCPSYGTGFSYTADSARKPVAGGFSIYFNDDDSETKELNADFRIAYATDMLTVDFSGGLGIPLKKGKDENDAAFTIDTIYVHSGLNFLAGSRYSHAFFLQFGLSDISLKKEKKSAKKFNADSINLIIEPRIFTEEVKYRLTLFNLNKDSVKDSFYLEDRMGLGITVFFDALGDEKGKFIPGLHVIGSTDSVSLYDYISGDSENDAGSNMNINAYISPFLKVKAGGGDLETMLQIGVKDILDGLNFQFKLKAGYKKIF